MRELRTYTKSKQLSILAFLGAVALLLSAAAIITLTPSRAFAAAGDVFTDTIEVGGNTTSSTYKIIAEDPDTNDFRVQIGDGINAAVDSSSSGALVLPSTVTHEGIDYAVTAVGSKAFYLCTGLTSTGLANNTTVETVGNHAYYGCAGLTSTGFAENATVSSVGIWSFTYCYGLTSTGLETNTGITSLGGNAFYNCPNIAGDLVIPAQLQTIGDRAFYATNIDAVYLKASSKDATSFGNDAFTLGISRYIPTMYVLASWDGTTSFNRYSTDASTANELVIMTAPNASLAFVSASRETHDTARIVLNVGRAGYASMSDSSGMVLWSGAVVQGANTIELMGLAPEAYEGLTAENSWTVTFPSSAVPKDYNSVRGVSMSQPFEIDAFKYKIAFDPNGGQGNVSAAFPGFGEVIPLPLASDGISKAGSTLVSWSTSPDGSGERYEPGQTVVDLTSHHGDTVTLYAIWETSDGGASGHEEPGGIVTDGGDSHGSASSSGVSGATDTVSPAKSGKAAALPQTGDGVAATVVLVLIGVSVILMLRARSFMSK